MSQNWDSAPLNLTSKVITLIIASLFFISADTAQQQDEQNFRVHPTYIIWVWTEVTSSTRVTWRIVTTIHGGIVVFEACCEFGGKKKTSIEFIVCSPAYTQYMGSLIRGA